MIGKFVSREIKEDKNGNAYYNVKTDRKEEGHQYAISFFAFNSEYNKFADIAKELKEGTMIDFEVVPREYEKQDGSKGIGWNLKSLKVAEEGAVATPAPKVANFPTGNSPKGNDSTQSPPIVSNVLGNAVGNSGLVTILVGAGDLQKTEIPDVLRVLSDCAWEASKGPSTVKEEPVPMPDDDSDPIPF